jgi:hypothetical protein
VRVGRRHRGPLPRARGPSELLGLACDLPTTGDRDCPHVPIDTGDDARAGGPQPPALIAPAVFSRPFFQPSDKHNSRSQGQSKVRTAARDRHPLVKHVSPGLEPIISTSGSIGTSQGPATDCAAAANASTGHVYVTLIKRNRSTILEGYRG